MKRTLGVCYYPEHWPEDMWATDAARMVEIGLNWVRIGEFAWSRMEPAPGDLQLEWLDRAIETLGVAGLQVILGTPTATPPRWMLDKHPDMLAVDNQGRARKFGSRRHYCFSHAGYRAESRRITKILAERYGKNPHVAAWQTDNEYDCHDTVLSYSNAACTAFQDWLAQRYQSTDALNRAWGNVFWSMDYDTFAQIDLPNLTVTEPNPAHVLAYRRFSSSQVVLFNRVQCDEIRKHSSAPIIHNYMGRITSFDHYDVGADLDIASWDSYPMGFLMDRVEGDEDYKAAYLRQGDPDFQAFHHDLYRTVGHGRWWIMEQQPGPVNWAPWNPAPLPGMPRLWAWEAFAHGAETVCYFRWRQAPFAQEQMHAGLLRPDSANAPAVPEVQQVAAELAQMPDAGTARATAALIFDYPSAFAWEAQPQGKDFDYFRLCFDYYSALRRAGLSIDILPRDTADLSQYDVVMAPGLLTFSNDFLAGIRTCTGRVFIGPRAGQKTEELSISMPMGPSIPGLNASAIYVESLPPSEKITLTDGGQMHRWFEAMEADETQVIERTSTGAPAILGHGQLRYLAGWPDAAALDRLVGQALNDQGKTALALPDGLRVRDTDTHRFWINYGAQPVTYQGRTFAPADVEWVIL